MNILAAACLCVGVVHKAKTETKFIENIRICEPRLLNVTRDLWRIQDRDQKGLP